MSPEQQAAINSLRHEGYAVITWTPEELRGANPGDVEEASIASGYDAIRELATEPEEDHEGEDEIFRCDSCGREARYGDLPRAKDLDVRLDAGAPYTNVECPECGALCYPKPEEAP